VYSLSERRFASRAVAELRLVRPLAMSKIVITQNDMTMTHKIAELCQEMRHEVFPTTNLAQAIEKAQKIHADLIITNFQPADEARVTLRDWHGRFPQFRVIIVSGMQGDLAAEALEVGAFDFIRKPFSISEFRFRIQRAFAN
jgi:DNA-binding NtrC family response regulator